MPTLNVHFLPSHVDASALAGSTVIVVDLLRASSTICQALASRAICVMPFLEIDETRRAAERLPRSKIVLGGERQGRIIEGFDLGNSPLEYTPDAVAGRQVLFTTTNGTRALLHGPLAKRTLIGCALNRKAVADSVAGAPQVDILCAGTDGAVTGEDIMAAGAIAQSLLDKHDIEQINRGARNALAAWALVLSAARQFNLSVAEAFAQEMRETPGGSNLLYIGHDADLVACSQLDTLGIVPEFDRATGEIRPA